MCFGFESICTVEKLTKTCPGPERSSSNQIKSGYTEAKQFEWCIRLVWTSLKFILARCITEKLNCVNLRVFLLAFIYLCIFALLYGGCASAELLKLILNGPSPTFRRASNPLILKAHEVAVY